MRNAFMIRVPNPLYHLLYEMRIHRAINKLSADLDLIEGQTLADKDRCKWRALMWQEIWMWISIADPAAPPRELDGLAERRGFNAAQRDYLEQMMRHVWLWKPQRKGADV